MTLDAHASARLEYGEHCDDYKQCIDAVFDALKQNLPYYLAFAEDDRAANLEAQIVRYLASCDYA